MVKSENSGFFRNFCSQLHIVSRSSHLIEYIEDIQMFLLNMAFISSSEVENIYIS